MKFKFLTFVIGFVSLAAAWVLFAQTGEAATLTAKPSAAEVAVGQTFTVNLTLNTEGQNVNAIELGLSYPPDKLQLISPSSGTSVIEIYSTPPRFNNQAGRIDIAGGIPGGISTPNGLVATLTFRAKSNGSATLRFLDNTKTLLNDGNGTNALTQTNNGTVNLRLPAPEGPLVSSPSHPNQEVWYQEKNVRLIWQPETELAGYSYVISDKADSIVDEIVDGTTSEITYKELNDGIHYFHIKALRNGVWGGTTRFAIHIDSSPPAVFPIDVTPSSRTSSTQPFVTFSTTDALSGLDRYELKLVPLINKNVNPEDLLFFEATSPYVTQPLELGSYIIVVRAYDKAGNSIDISQDLVISNFIGRWISSKGLEIAESVTVPWWLVLLILLALAFGIFMLFRKARKHYAHVHTTDEHERLPDGLRTQLDELKKYRQRYGKLAAMLLLCISLGMFGSISGQATAQESENNISLLGPPNITTYPENITEEDIFYLAGRTQDPSTEVIIHLQKASNGETFDLSSFSDKRGDWFYRHSSNLEAGAYFMWVQSRIGEQLSPPSGKVEMNVNRVAFNFSGSKITYQTVYQISIIGLTILVILLALALARVVMIGRNKLKKFKADILRAEEHLRQGFNTLQRDLESELTLLRRLNLSAELSAEEKIREEQIKDDLIQIEGFVKDESREINEFLNS